MLIQGYKKKIPVTESVGLALAHDITEIRPGELKCRAYKRGHVIKNNDIEHLLRLGKEHVFVLNIGRDEIHEDDAAYCLASALIGRGVCMDGKPKEGKINMLAERDGLLKINSGSLLRFNMIGSVMCATLHDNTLVKKGQIVAGTRAIPLVVQRRDIENAISAADHAGKVIEVKELKRPRAGVVITGNEVYTGRIKDAFAPVITRKIEAFDGELVGIHYSPDDEETITKRLMELIEAGADVLITTGGMSVDPDDVTRFAIKNLGAADLTYGSGVLPGAMFLIAYIDGGGPDKDPIPIMGLPACGIYHKTTVFDLIFPRVLAGEKIGRKELAELGHGGLCMNCRVCNYPFCPFGKG